VEAEPVAVTKSWESKVLELPGTPRAPASRIGWREFTWLAAASLLVSAGLVLVYSAKTVAFPALAGSLDRGELLDLNQVTKPDDLLPFLLVFSDPAERESVAQRTFEFLRARQPVQNVGALARLRISDTIRKPLLPLAKLKPAFVVRTPREFQIQFAIRIAVYLAGFYVVFLVWRWSGFRGDFAILPAIHLLSGMGLILAVSLRDPLRDTLELSKFAWGVGLGCIVLLLVLRPALRGFPSVRGVAPVRIGTRRQRRESKSGSIPAGRSHQDPAGVFPGRLFRAELGAAARSA
jgi:hypothetical protein